MQDLFIDFRQAESVGDLALMLSVSEELLQAKLDSDNPTVKNLLQRKTWQLFLEHQNNMI